MSSLAVKVERVLSVEPHPNADRLDLIQVLDWKCVTQKGNFKPGDLCVYLPIDSVLPEPLETFLFGPDAKVKLHNSRIRTIKLRGAISQGMAVRVSEIERYRFGEHVGLLSSTVSEGTELTATLGVTKYEPPEAPARMGGGFQTSRKQTNPHFHKYTDIENGKNHPNVFTVTDRVVITEKIHGTSFRAGYVPFHADNLWKKIKQLLGLAPRYEFVYGSRNVQLQSKMLYNGYYHKNVYSETVNKYNLKAVLRPGEVVYGEIYGDGIQKGYTYGCGPDERNLVVFDFQQDGRYVDAQEFGQRIRRTGLTPVPLLSSAHYDPELVKTLCKGPSVLSPTQTVREGVVVKPWFERTSHMGRVVLKYINEEYLLKEQTEFH